MYNVVYLFIEGSYNLRILQLHGCNVLMPGRQLLFCLDAKSNQKNQEKMMLALARAFAGPAIFSGLHTLLKEKQSQGLRTRTKVISSLKNL